MPKIGDLGDNIAVLREMRTQLIESTKRIEIEEERWEALNKAASRISMACEDRDLEYLVTAARDLKNRLRRPSIRRELAKLEAQESQDEKGKNNDPPIVQPKKKEDPDGACKCSECGKIIDGSSNECEEDSLCIDCALKKKPRKEKDKEKDKEKKSNKRGDSVDKEYDDERTEKGSVKEGVLARGYLRRRSYMR